MAGVNVATRIGWRETFEPLLRDIAATPHAVRELRCDVCRRLGHAPGRVGLLAINRNGQAVVIKLRRRSRRGKTSYTWILGMGRFGVGGREALAGQVWLRGVDSVLLVCSETRRFHRRHPLRPVTLAELDRLWRAGRPDGSEAIYLESA